VWSLLEIQEIAEEIEAVVDSDEEAEMAGVGILPGQKRITGL